MVHLQNMVFSHDFMVSFKEFIFAVLVARILLWSLHWLRNEISLFQWQLEHMRGSKARMSMWYLRQLFLSLPFVHPWLVSFNLLDATKYTRVERTAMVILEFLMALTKIGILLPVTMLGVSDPLIERIRMHTYGTLRQWFGEIEFSERILQELSDVSEAACDW